MYISGLHSINFGAQSISTPKIKHYDEENRDYHDAFVSFVELNPKDKNDVDSVVDAVKYWRNDLYGHNIVSAMKQLAHNKEQNPSEKIYAVVIQKDLLSKLNPEKIAALAQVYETKKRVRLVYLQVNPDYIYSNSEYKRIGSGMLNSLKTQYHDRSIILVPAASAVDFYKKQGFVDCNDGANRMIWNKKAEDDSENAGEYW